MPKSLRLEDYADHELLYLLNDVGDREGWATSQEVADKLGITNKEGTHNVGSRFAWCFRFGWLEKHEEARPTKWRLTDAALDLLFPTDLSSAAQQALDNLDEAQKVAVLKTATRQLGGGTSRQAMHLARREVTYSIGNWRDKSIAAKRKTA